MRLRQDVHDQVYSGEVTPMPGCPDIAVSHAVYCHTAGGKGKDANVLRLTQIRELGYSSIICTVQSNNLSQIAILSDIGWDCVYTVVNKRTGSTLLVYMTNL